MILRPLVRVIFFTIIFSFFSQLSVFSQVEILKKEPVIFPPKLSFGVGTGINHYPGLLGIVLETPVNEKITLLGSVGVGGWGWKLGVNGRYYFKDVFGGSAISLGLSRSTGGENVPLDLEVISGNTETVLMDLKPVHTINLAYVYAFNLKNKHKISLSFGVSRKLNNGENYVIKSNSILSDNSETLMSIIQPGGITLGVDILFGVIR